MSDEDELRDGAREKESLVPFVELTCTLEDFIQINQLKLEVNDVPDPSRVGKKLYVNLIPLKGHIETSAGSGAVTTGYGNTVTEATEDLRLKLTNTKVYVGTSFSDEHLESGWPFYKKYNLVLTF